MSSMRSQTRVRPMIVERSMHPDWLSNTYLVARGPATLPRCAGADPPPGARAGRWCDRRPQPRRHADDRRHDRGSPAHAGPYARDALARRRRHRRLHRRHAVQELGRRRPGARPHDLRGPQALDHGRAARAAARDDDPPRSHRPDYGRRRAREQRVRARLARSRSRGRRAVHRDGRAGDADPARRRLRRRSQGVGPLAGRRRRHHPRLAGLSLAWRGVSDDKRTQGGLSARTLLIAGAASAVAALVIPMLWRPGTVFAAAMTPIVVALVSELLHRPVETVSAVRVRRTPRGTAILDRQPEEPFDPLAPPPAEDLA